jgi:vacuolar iron transporter family protein
LKRNNMQKSLTSNENHHTGQIGWLRAAVLGANDGIVSTASLLIGVAAASADHQNLILTGVAGLVAGAMSMAAGEYVSVHSQADTEKADLNRERTELDANPTAELRELTAIYVTRGLDPDLASTVAQQLMRHDAIGTHGREELGISDLQSAKPLQAALASAASFALGSALPLTVAVIAPGQGFIVWASITSIVFLAALGAISARVGGAPMFAAIWRVAFWGALAMGITAAVGKLFGAVV